jgi:Domain of unknown function (DUF4105)
VRPHSVLKVFALSFGLALGIPLPSPAASQEEPAAALSPSDSMPPEPGSNLEVYLITAAPGDAIWERFSHNALLIRDADTGREVAYNWGIFSFQQESFIKRLAQGRMLYAMYGVDMGRMAASYRADERTLYSNRVNLTPAEALELQRALREMDTDANRHYRYDYYRDNCSTRVRDALDSVLGGRIRARWSDVPTPNSYRWHTRRLVAAVPWAYYGIQFVLGVTADEPISAWEDMFLPLPLMRYLEQTEITRADGSTRPLLGERVTLYEASRPPVPTDTRSFLIPSLLVSLLLGGALALLAQSGAGGSAVGRWGFALLGGAWALLSGALGTGLIAAWLFTDHVFWRWNENVLLMNPLWLFIAGALLAGAWSGGRARAARWARWGAVLALGGTVLIALPWVGQRSLDFAALVLPTHLALAWGATRLARER